MENIKIKGIVIGSIDYKETSKIVYLYTKLGKISVKALGSKTKKSKTLSFTTTLNTVECIITNSEFPTLIDYTVIDQNRYIKEELKTNLWMSYILEIVNKFPSDANHERCFDFLLRTIDHANNKINPMLLAILFQLKVLSVFGVAPVLKRCVKCGNIETIGLNINDGGAVCINCKTSKTLDKEILEKIKELYYFDDKENNFDKFENYNLIEIFNIINTYYDTHSNIYLKGLNSLVF